MFRLLKKWFHLSRADRCMFLHVLCLTGILRAFVIMLPFKWIARYLGKQGMNSPAEENVVKLEAAQKIGRAVEIVSRYTPWESKCMVQAITAKVLVRKRGIANTMYFGVRKNKKNGLVAHAWLRVGPAIITGNCSVEEFKVVSLFGDYGCDYIVRKDCSE